MATPSHPILSDATRFGIPLQMEWLWPHVGAATSSSPNIPVGSLASPRCAWPSRRLQSQGSARPKFSWQDGSENGEQRHTRWDRENVAKCQQTHWEASCKGVGAEKCSSVAGVVHGSRPRLTLRRPQPSQCPSLPRSCHAADPCLSVPVSASPRPSVPELDIPLSKMERRCYTMTAQRAARAGKTVIAQESSSLFPLPFFLCMLVSCRRRPVAMQMQNQKKSYGCGGHLRGIPRPRPLSARCAAPAGKPRGGA